MERAMHTPQATQTAHCNQGSRETCALGKSSVSIFRETKTREQAKEILHSARGEKAMGKVHVFFDRKPLVASCFGQKSWVEPLLGMTEVVRVFCFRKTSEFSKERNIHNKPNTQKKPKGLPG